MRSRRVLHAITIVTVVAGLAVLVAGWKADAQRTASHDALRVSPPRPVLAPANPASAVDFGSGPVVSAPPSTTAPAAPPAPTAAAPPIASTASPSAGAPVSAAAPAPSSTTSEVATIVRPTISVYDQPGAARASEALLSTTEFGNPRVLPVTQRGGDWLRVELPTRPNGSEGWVHASDVQVGTVDDHVDVDLAARQLVWTHAGQVRLVVPTGIGAPESPTPVGDFFVTDVLPSDPGGAYGAWVVALDGHSDAFTTFEGGDPRIAIHGTNAPGTVGLAASNGCLRVDPAALAALAAALPPGTPVNIH